MTPRGLRNNNPGNIRLGDPWKGLAEHQTDPSFCVFIAPEYGFRAMARLLVRYQSAHRCATVRAMIARWAPPNENDTAAYIASVAKAAGVDADTPVNLRESPLLFRRVLRAICVHENGYCPYTDETIDEGLRMAGVDGETKEG